MAHVYVLSVRVSPGWVEAVTSCCFILIFVRFWGLTIETSWYDILGPGRREKGVKNHKREEVAEEGPREAEKAPRTEGKESPEGATAWTFLGQRSFQAEDES